MGIVNQPEDVYSQLRALQEQINDLRRKVGLSSAVLTAGLSVRTADSGTRLDIGSTAITIVGDAANDDDAPRVVLQASDAANTRGRLQGEVYGSGTLTDLSTRRASDDVVDGGKALLWQAGAVFGWQPAAGEESFLSFNWPYSGQITVRGKFPNYAVAHPTDALFTGSVPIGGPGTGVALSYGATMASPMVPVTTIEDNPVTAYGHVVSASSTTGFTVQLGAASNGNYKVNFWCFRTV